MVCKLAFCTKLETYDRYLKNFLLKSHNTVLPFHLGPSIKEVCPKSLFFFSSEPQFFPLNLYCSYKVHLPILPSFNQGWFTHLALCNMLTKVLALLLLWMVLYKNLQSTINIHLVCMQGGSGFFYHWLHSKGHFIVTMMSYWVPGGGIKIPKHCVCNKWMVPEEHRIFCYVIGANPIASFKFPLNLLAFNWGQSHPIF